MVLTEVTYKKNVKLLLDLINYNDSFWESSTISQYKES